MDIRIDEKKIINSVNSCSFEKLVEKEKKEGFIEAIKLKKNDEKINFFYLGKNNNWKNLLDSKIEEKIRTSFLSLESARSMREHLLFRRSRQAEPAHRRKILA